MNLPTGARRLTGFLSRILVAMLGTFISSLALAQTVDLSIAPSPTLTYAAGQSALAPGDTFAVDGTIVNTGSAPATGSAVTYFLSANNTLERSDRYLGYSPGGALASGQTQPRTATLTLPAGTPAGDYYILFVADFGNSELESNETNNIQSVATTVISPFQVELTLQSAVLGAAAVQAGQAVTAAGTLVNSGNTDVEPHQGTAGFYLSTDSTLEAGDVLLETDTVATTFAAGSTEPVSASLSIPAGTATGHYYILFVADYGQGLAEPDETNNVRAVHLMVYGKPLPFIPRPDLSFRAPATISPNPVKADEQLMTMVEVMYDGTVAANVEIRYYLSPDEVLDTLGAAADVLLGTSMAAIEGGQATVTATRSLTIPAATVPGNYYLLLRLDPSQAIPESNEANNLTSAAVNVAPAPLPDLTFATPPSVSTTVVAPGERINYITNIRNVGTVRAPGPTAGFFLSADTTFDATDLLLANSFFSSPPPGNGGGTASSFQIPASTAPGQYYLLFIIDYHNHIQESTKTNNVHTIAITVSPVRPPDAPALPDLAYSYLLINGLAKSPGDTLVANIRISNAGTATAGASYVGYFLSTKFTIDSSAIFLGRTMVSPLDRDQESAHPGINIMIPHNTPPGIYFLHFIADYSEEITERSEANNTSVSYITITGTGADLRNTGYSAKVIAGPAGTTTSVTVNITNFGSSPAAASQVYFYLSTNANFDFSDTLIGYTDIAALPGNQQGVKTESLTIPMGTAPGSYFIIAVADAGNTVAETQEHNNTAIISFVVGQGDVLIVADSPALLLNLTTNTSIPARPVTVAAGDRVEASFKIRNDGAVAAVFTHFRCVLSTDRVYDAGDVLLEVGSAGILEPNNGDTFLYPILPIPAKTSPGSFYLLFVLDDENRIAETDETNNLGVLALTVAAAPVADLAVRLPALQLALAAPGDTLDLTATVANTGTATATATITAFYLSHDTTLDSTDVVLGDQILAAMMAPGDTATHTPALILPASTARGNYYLLVAADAESTLKEASEENNIRSVALRVGAAGKDLVVRSHTSPGQIAAGAASPVTASLFNEGVEAAAASTISLYLSADARLDSTDRLVGSGAGDSLAAVTAADRTFGLSIPLRTAPGHYYLLYHADPANEVPESDEGNNTLTVALTITAPALPDLTITTATAAAALPGSPATVTTRVKNLGTAPVLAATVSFYLSADTTFDAADALLGTSAAFALEAAAEAEQALSLTIPAATVPGSYHLLVVADPANQETETDETNNQFAVAFPVTAPAPDLAVQPPALNTATVARGSAVSVTATITNQGTAPAPATPVTFYLSVNNTYESEDVPLGEGTLPALAPGASHPVDASLTIPPATSTGDYYVLVAADVAGQNGESRKRIVASVALAVSIPNGIKQADAPYTITIAPNPAPDQVTITISQVKQSEKSATVILTDLSGREVLMARAPIINHKLSTRVQVQPLSPGTYILHIRIGDTLATRRIVVAR